MAKAALLYSGTERLEIDGLDVLPFGWALPRLATILS
jgi:hypothetical protein